MGFRYALSGGARALDSPVAILFSARIHPPGAVRKRKKKIGSGTKDIADA
jgi:hypothetical protein